MISAKQVKATEVDSTPTVLYGAMVRALVVVYFADHGDTAGVQRLDLVARRGGLDQDRTTQGSFQLNAATWHDFANLTRALAQK